MHDRLVIRIGCARRDRAGRRVAIDLGTVEPVAPKVDAGRVAHKELYFRTGGRRHDNCLSRQRFGSQPVGEASNLQIVGMPFGEAGGHALALPHDLKERHAHERKERGRDHDLDNRESGFADTARREHTGLGAPRPWLLVAHARIVWLNRGTPPHVMGDERGYTLMEVMIAVGMIALLAVAGLGFTLSMKPLELSAATTQFDSVVASARSVATAFGDGATIFVTTTPGSIPNFRAQVYGHRPGGTLPVIPSAVPPLDAKTAITETAEVHDPSFAIIIHGNGDIGARSNFNAGDTAVGPELGCPAGQNAFTFVFTVNGQTATRLLPCHINLAASGSITTSTPPASPTSPPAGSETPQPITTPLFPGSPGCPTGSNLVGEACRYPLVAMPAELNFFSPVDAFPVWYDANGNPLSTASNLVTVSENNYFATYTVDTSACSAMINPNLSLAYTGSTATFSIAPLPQPAVFSNCFLTVSDGNLQSPQVNVSIAGPLTVVDASQNVLAVAPGSGTDIIPAASSTSWTPVTLYAIKANFLPATPIASISGCGANVSTTPGLSPQPPGNSLTVLTLQGVGTTFDSQGVDHPCSLIVTDQSPTGQSNESATLSITVNRLPNPLPTPSPSAPCSIDSFGFCIISDVLPDKIPCQTSDGELTREFSGLRTVTIYGTTTGIVTFTFFETDAGTGNCLDSVDPGLWNPGEPQTVLGDPNLP